MNKDNIKKISDYIDALNNEVKPNIENEDNDQELEKMMATVRLVRTLREPQLPDADYPKRLAQAVADRIQKEKQMDVIKQARHSSKHRKKFIFPAAALAACLLLFMLVNWFSFYNRNVVYAMEKAVSKLYSYHGTLEIRTRNEAGDEWLVRKLELWYEGDKYAIKQDDGTLTVNNGEQKWQVNHDDREVILLPLLPDPTKDSFDLRDEARLARQYPYTIVGTEEIAGREAVKLTISPPGGEEYNLWVDSETNLPIQLQTAMANALQTTYTFVSFNPNVDISSEKFAYQVPEGYKVVENDPGQRVASIEEASAISGIVPLLPDETPKRILAFKNKIVLDYGNTTITEYTPIGDFKIAPNASLGTASNGPLEIWEGKLRWRQEGLEIIVEGIQRVKLAKQIASDLTIPDITQDLVSKAKVKVPVDMEIVEANQKQVDRGSSPWQLDPLQVALTFVNLKVTPEGIEGEPQIPMSSLNLIANNSVESIVDIVEGPIKRVYLKRLIRQDETGIWTVVGYDPR